ncbi:hypothetical protein [Lacrimispora sp.]|jgi:hypothetical protein|uniref:hypothetical protein n=1 Tax=Lacrimispora sp. TaxID=2719234 RepID=UPI0028A1DD8E|nr:hypothetical protein [Lacrimispora sp.]
MIQLFDIRKQIYGLGNDGADELVGEEIPEIGLFDSDGDLVVYRTLSRKGKDADIPQSYEMPEIF